MLSGRIWKQIPQMTSLEIFETLSEVIPLKKKLPSPPHKQEKEKNEVLKAQETLKRVEKESRNIPLL